MKRTIALLATVGAVVLLAGCGSSSAGTAAPAATVASVSSSDTAVTSSSDTAVTSSSDTAVTSSSDTESSSDSSSSSDTSASGPATTIGDNSGTLDAPTTKWFDTFCTGFGSFGDLQDMSSALGNTSDPAAAQKQVVALFNKIGGSFTSTSAALKDLPPPTFTGGDAFANKIIPVLSKFGTALTDAAKKAAAVDVAKDPTGLVTALSGVSGSMTDITSSMSEFQNLKVTPQTQAAVEAIPSCAKLKSLGG